MELLVLKSNDNYIRIKGNSFEFTNMDKASVYPLSEVKKVKDFFDKLQKDISDLTIRKIVITETEFIDY